MSASQSHLLVVDDQTESLLLLDELLGSHYCVHAATSGLDALSYLAGGGRAELVILDVVMPDMDGFELCEKLKADPRTASLPVIFLTGLSSPEMEARGLKVGAADFIQKPLSPPVVLARVSHHLQLRESTLALQQRAEDLERMITARTEEIVFQARELARRNQQLIAAQGATIVAFCALAESRDNETGNHIKRTQHYVRLMAEAIRDMPRFRGEIDEEIMRLLFISAPLHDIGKVAIPDAILLKPAALTPEEWVVMRQHTTFGRNAVLEAEQSLGCEGGFLRYAREIAFSHHERWDGAGYPQGLAGEAIPLSARLMAVADVYDALRSKRVYKPAFPHERALTIIREGRGKHFDPDLADAMLARADEFAAIANQFSDEDLPPT